MVGCVGLALSAYCSGSTFWMMAWICLAMSGTLALIPTYISLPGAMFSGTAAAARSEWRLFQTIKAAPKT